MKITSTILGASQLNANDEALDRCQRALTLKDKGDYYAAQKVMRPLWQRVGERPEISSLHAAVAAEVLLCVGVLTRWIGSKNKVEGSQETAKNFITESITFYESIGDLKSVATARVELACCYWREGALDEARVTLTAALQKLTTEGNTRARALLTLAIVEWSASRFNEALRILNENASLFNKITNHATQGAYHSQLAMVLRKLAPPEKPLEHFKRILKEYEEADEHFKSAHNIVFRADVKNNIGNLFRELCRFKEAHQYLEQARRLRSSVRDKIGIAQIDDTRAQVFIAEKKYKEAEAVARNAVRVLEKSGHQCLLTDVLITQGIALARLKQTDHAQFIFQKAIEVAHQVGALNKAGLAALTMIEELDQLATETLYAAYDRASEWLATSQSQDLLVRLNAAARKVLARLHGEAGGEHTAVDEANTEDTQEILLNKPCVLQEEVWKFEGGLIREALAKASGSLTRAAALLSMSYQALAYILESRHKDLLKERSPIRRRSRKETAPEGSLNS
jgi:tetratricopeptide (TPR) repeat protein